MEIFSIPSRTPGIEEVPTTTNRITQVANDFIKQKMNSLDNLNK